MLTAAELGRQYRTGRLSPVEVVEAALKRANETQDELRPFILVMADTAREQARQSQTRYRQGRPLGPLDGVPVGLKDLIHVAGFPTTAASKILAGVVARKDAEVVRRLKEGGAVILGKTNLHEFAYGSDGAASAAGPARNPWDPARIAGGSSSGSAVAIAAGICPIALGSDTGGSIRIPASLSGIVGLKPTYGMVSCEGVIPLSWSLDHVGPMCTTVEDAAIALGVLAGFEPPDLSAVAASGNGTPRPRIGVCHELFFDPMQPEVRRVVEMALPELGDVREVSIPHISFSPTISALIIGGEASAFHHHWIATRPDDYHPTVRNRLRAAEKITASEYVEAMRLRGLLVDEMLAAFADVDLLAMPTEPIAAPLFGETETELESGSGHPLALTLRNTAPFNISGFPAISVPCGFTRDRLPVGLQLVAPPRQEALLLKLAHRYEQQRGPFPLPRE